MKYFFFLIIIDTFIILLNSTKGFTFIFLFIKKLRSDYIWLFFPIVILITRFEFFFKIFFKILDLGAGGCFNIFKNLFLFKNLKFNFLFKNFITLMVWGCSQNILIISIDRIQKLNSLKKHGVLTINNILKSWNT